MTQRGPGEHVDELISASLSGNLDDAERRLLIDHLADCERCRETLAAFTAERRYLSGLRQAPVPRDLAARVRAGIESGRFAAVPWWRRPSGLLVAGATVATAVAAVLVGVLISTNLRPPVASSNSPLPTASSPASATPSVPATSSAAASGTPGPSQSAAPLATQPVGYLVLTRVNAADPSKGSRLQVVAPQTNQAIVTITTPSAQNPISGGILHASLSPDGRWVAFVSRVGAKGTAAVWAARLSDGVTVSLGEGAESANPFYDQLAWSADGSVLAYTLISGPDPAGPSDVWLFRPSSSDVRQLTASGSAVAASFEPGITGGSAQLWVSVASASGPTSYRLAIPTASGTSPEKVQPATAATATVSGAFLPLLAPDGRSAVVWHGQMAKGAGWQFQRGGMPYLVTAADAASLKLSDMGQPLFPSLTLAQGGGFGSAAIAWSAGSDGFVVWNTAWTGVPQTAGFPDHQRIYLGHVRTGELIGANQALDAKDVTGTVAAIQDVKLAPDGLHLAITVARPLAGDLSAPAADLIIVKREYGTTPDGVSSLGAGGSWNGPGLYPSVGTP